MLKTNLTIKDLQHHIKNIDHKPEKKMEVMLKLFEEVGELAVEIRKEISEGLTEQRKQNIEFELYDILHYVNHIANIYDVDLEKAIHEKDAYNAIKYARKEEKK